MKKLTYFVALAFIMSAVSVVSCSSGGTKGDGKNGDSKKETTVKTPRDSSLTKCLEIRYIDEERLLEEYNLAKDFKESMTRSQSKLVSATQSREKDIQQLAAQIESKMKSNGYSTETEYNADMARLQKKQQDAQSYLANLQRSTEIEMNQLQTQLQDSIKSFVKTFSEENGYDAVLLQSAGFYFSLSLDVTDEVIEGLNAGYNKVAK